MLWTYSDRAVSFACVSVDEMPYEVYVQSCIYHAPYADKVESILAKLRALAEDECCICLDAGGDCITRCTHVFHRACIEKALASTSGACPLCRQPVRVAELIEHVEESADVDDAAVPPNLTVGAKLQTLKQYISDMDKSEKLVVFSSFVKYLDLAKAALESPDAGEEKVCMLSVASVFWSLCSLVQGTSECA